MKKDRRYRNNYGYPVPPSMMMFDMFLNVFLICLKSVVEAWTLSLLIWIANPACIKRTARKLSREQRDTYA